MKNRCKKILRKIVLLFYKKQYLQNTPVKRLFHYLFFQKILRINSHAPWPVHWSSVVGNIENIFMEDESAKPGFSPGCYINTFNKIYFGKNVWIGPGVKIISANHDQSNYYNHIISEPIIIGNNCWIGGNAVILPSVELGEHTIVGAGAVVTKSFEGGNCILGGNPAKIIKKIGKYDENINVT